MEAEDLTLARPYVMRDNDTKFTAQFDPVIESSGAKIKRNTSPRKGPSSNSRSTG